MDMGVWRTSTFVDHCWARILKPEVSKNKWFRQHELAHVPRMISEYHLLHNFRRQATKWQVVWPIVAHHCGDEHTELACEPFTTCKMFSSDKNAVFASFLWLCQCLRRSIYNNERFILAHSRGKGLWPRSLERKHGGAESPMVKSKGWGKR